MDFLVDIGIAVWLGILTSISPCPLAINIAAVSFISKQVETSKQIFLRGITYALGRSITYIALGSLLVTSIHLIPNISMYLQNQFRLIIGPLLIIVGVFILGVIPINFKGNMLSHNKQQQLAKSGLCGVFLLGLIFAMAFCPISAALFFGNTLGLATKYGSRIILPSAYGIGTAMPVIAFAWIIAFSAKSLGESFNKVQTLEKWMRIISGMIFIGAGIYTLF